MLLQRQLDFLGHVARKPPDDAIRLSVLLYSPIRIFSSVRLQRGREVGQGRLGRRKCLSVLLLQRQLDFLGHVARKPPDDAIRLSVLLYSPIRIFSSLRLPRGREVGQGRLGRRNCVSLLPFPQAGRHICMLFGNMLLVQPHRGAQWSETTAGLCDVALCSCAFALSLLLPLDMA